MSKEITQTVYKLVCHECNIKLDYHPLKIGDVITLQVHQCTKCMGVLDAEAKDRKVVIDDE